jgi:hypothetical protein
MNRPYSNWLIVRCVLLFLALSSGVVMRWIHSRPSYEFGQSVEQHLERLREVCPDLHILEVMPGRPQMGIHITVQPRKVQELSWLQRDGTEMAKRRGVVFAEGHVESMSELSMEEWQDFSFVTGDTIFFGDPELLERIRTVLREK